MCDYSLPPVAAGPAKVGDKLVSTRFPNSITRGFAAISEPNSYGMPATWYRTGSVEAEVRYEAAIALLPKKTLGERHGSLPLYRQWRLRAPRRSRISQREDRVAHAAV